MAKKTNGKRPRQADLIEDRAIKALEDVASDYCDIRDERMALTQREVELRSKAMQLMKKHNKTEYRHDGIEITIVPGEESIKVRVKKVDEKVEGEPDEPSGDEAHA